MYCKLLEKDADLTLFAARFTEQASVNLPFQYLRVSKVFGIFDGDLLVGGFNFTEGSAIRWAKLIDESKSDYLQKVDKSLIFEINGLWLSENLRKSRKSIKAWELIAKEIVAYEASVPTFAVLHSKPHLLNFYEKIGFVKIYSGMKLAGDDGITVFHVSKLKLKFFKLFYAADYLRRKLQGILIDGNPQRAKRPVLSRPGIQTVHIESSLNRISE